MRRQNQQCRELGLPHGGRKPFGWRDLIEPDLVESAALSDAMEAVVRWTASNRTLGGTDLRRVLTAPRHAGLVVHRGEIAVNRDDNEIRAPMANRDDGRVQAIHRDLTTLDFRRRAPRQGACR